MNQEYYTYVLSSLTNNYHYIGITDNINRRLNQHNKGYNKTTKPYRPFKLLFYEKFIDRKSARDREKWLKSGIGRDYISNLLNKNS